MRGKESEDAPRPTIAAMTKKTHLDTYCISAFWSIIRKSSLDQIPASPELGEYIMQGHMMGTTA